jgi:transposase
LRDVGYAQQRIRHSRLTQALVPLHVIDKGIPTAGLLAHVLVSKHGDHLPLYRQERIVARAGLATVPIDKPLCAAHGRDVLLARQLLFILRQCFFRLAPFTPRRQHR